VRERPRPAGAAARKAERPTHVTGTIGPTRESAGAPAGRLQAIGPSQLLRRRPRTSDLDAGVCRAGW